MINDQTRNELWHQLLDIERNCRYYETVYSRATNKQFWTRVVTLIALAGSITAILNLLPWGNDLVKTGLVALVTGLTVWDAVSNYPKKAAVAHVVHFQCAGLRTDIQDLWISVDDESANEEDTRRRLRDLARRASEIENWAGFSDIGINEKLNRRTTEEAYKVVPDRYRGNVPGTSQ